MSATITLHQSGIHLLRRCARRFYYEHELDGGGREPVQVPWTAADFGTTMHRGLAAWHLTGSLPVALEALEARGVGHDGRPFGPPKDAHERAAARAVLTAYAAHYHEQDAATFETVAAEVPFSADAPRVSGKVARGAVCRACGGQGAGLWSTAPIVRACPDCHGRGHTGPRIEGTIDLVARAEKVPTEPFDSLEEMAYPAPKQVTIIFDHKSVGGSGWYNGQVPPWLTSGAEIRIQAGMYVDAAVTLGHPMPELFVYNYLRRPAFDRMPSGPPKRAVKEDAKVNSPRWGESPLEYEQRLVKLIGEAPTEWFYRLEVTVTPRLLSESRANVVDTAWEIKQRRARGAWPMNDGSCTSYMQPCPWLPVCTGGESPRDERLYRIKRRNEENRA